MARREITATRYVCVCVCVGSETRSTQRPNAGGLYECIV